MSDTTNTDLPTVVLVHGAFADASSWNGVIERLQAKGVSVTAPAKPAARDRRRLRLPRRVLAQIEGPCRRRPFVRRRGDHERGNRRAERRRPRLRGGVRTRRGRDPGAVEAGSKDSVLNSALVPRRTRPPPAGSATEFYIDPAKARDAFAGDLSDEQAALIAATQRPVADAAFSEPSGPPAWKHLPVMGRRRHRDKAAGTDVTRSMAERAGAKITEVDGSHVIMVSQPEAVTNVILEAVAAVTAVPIGA